jgi:ATP-dependent helicase/nuclease subunit A
VPIWSPRRELRCVAAQRLRDEAARRRMEEHNRLLYVALTRAEDRLVICGWNVKRTPDDACWYRTVERAFDRLAATCEPFGTWQGDLRRHATPQCTEPERRTAEGVEARLADPPHWIGRSPGWRADPPPAEPDRPERLAPSRPEGAEHAPVPAAASPLAEREAATDRFRRGRLIHALLQHLPDLPAERWAAAARAWLDRPGHALPAGEAEKLARDTLAVLAHPALVPLFGPASRAEVPLTGVVGGSVIGGLVDRLAVLPDRVLIADFKTNRRPPRRMDDTPVLYLRQMAAYRAVLREIFPGRAVICALVWTEVSEVVILPDALLESHAPSHARDAA